MKIKTLSKIMLLTTTIIGFVACDRYCLEGNGKIKSEYRVVSEFTGVENNTSFDVKITNDTVFSIRVDADENLLESINTSVRDGNLIIEGENGQCIDSYSGALIDIRMPELEMAELNGSGSMDVFNFDCSSLVVKNTGSGDMEIRSLSVNELTVILSGSGDIFLDGTAAEVHYSLSGSGDIEGFDLKVDDCFVKNSGSGDVICFVYNHLDIDLTGSGDVVYAGPSTLIVDKKNSGSGDIYERD
jgi:hypothetical protein